MGRDGHVIPEYPRHHRASHWKTIDMQTWFTQSEVLREMRCAVCTRVKVSHGKQLVFGPVTLWVCSFDCEWSAKTARVWAT